MGVVKVEMKISDALDLQLELADLLRRKSSMKLKLQLTELQLRVEERTEAASSLIQDLFQQHGKRTGEGADAKVVIKRYVNEDNGEETEYYKDYMTIRNQKIEFECPLISIDLLEQVDSDASYPALVRLMMDSRSTG